MVRAPGLNVEIKIGHKKTAGGAGGFWRIQDVCLKYVQISRPPDARENQK
jgi:hypothetical protein